MAWALKRCESMYPRLLQSAVVRGYRPLITKSQQEFRRLLPENLIASLTGRLDCSHDCHLRLFAEIHTDIAGSHSIDVGAVLKKQQNDLRLDFVHCSQVQRREHLNIVKGGGEGGIGVCASSLTRERVDIGTLVQ